MKKTLLFLLLIISISLTGQTTYYVATNGNDSSGNGSNDTPWATIQHALNTVTDGSTILVKPGTYNGRVRVRGSFTSGVLVKSQVSYMAKLRNNTTVITAYKSPNGCHGITFDGFDIAHDAPGAAPLVIHIDGDGNGDVHDITFQNCIIHDSYNNDLVKVNAASYNITFQGNLFFNQAGSDEHIDGNSVENLIIQDNIFLNDFSSSGRTNNNDTSSFIVIKDSGGSNDIYTGSRNVKIRRNVFLNWEGTVATNFVLIGEDSEPHYQAFDIMIENNLMLGNSSNPMRAPFGIKGCRDITFRNNTVTGDLPANAYAFRFNREPTNPIINNINIYNNIWSDPTGTMNDFSDCPISHTDTYTLDTNVYWNNGTPIPQDSSDKINSADDANGITANPLLGDLNNLIIPHYDSSLNQFKDGSVTIREAFERIVNTYGTPETNSPVINMARADQLPADDILGRLRVNADIGAVAPGAVENNELALIRPDNGSENISITPTLEWSGSASSYTLEITDCSPIDPPPPPNPTIGLGLDQFNLIEGPKTITQIPDDLSGLTYNSTTNTIFAVINDPPRLYELNLDGDVIRSIPLQGFNDTEGLVWVNGTDFFVIEEKRGRAVKITVENTTTTIAYPTDYIQLPGNWGANNGLEGVGYTPDTNELILVKEKSPLTIYSLEVPADLSTSPTVTNPFDIATNNFGFRDLSGLHHLGNNTIGHNTHFLVLSHESRALVETDVTGKEYSRLDLGPNGANGTLPDRIRQAEGITVDNQGAIYIVSEPNTFYKFSKSASANATKMAPIFTASNIPEESFVVPENTLTLNTEYCWRIKDNDTGDWTSYFSFTTGNNENPPPPPPLPPLPVETTNTIQVFPNPADTFLSVLFDFEELPENIQVFMYDISGKEILRQSSTSIVDNALHINVSRFSKGCYFLKIKYPKEDIVKSFIKK
ncbi:hypothetical protein ATO12_25070 [Aquimarina atlantica]|uniref:Secretion system C-terminal sorting domain-containing protein n=1 Tax=Aquimarina atlantica TaxID=1317122 RepID=A0A023BR65_9FLAO|nr:SdiA-regulated domain-containing protein [Aquimarina atlantica]EZH72208.1 hypothetical protein ATO12_25070 [Aquimarina atlantica]